MKSSLSAALTAQAGVCFLLPAAEVCPWAQMSIQSAKGHGPGERTCPKSCRLPFLPLEMGIVQVSGVGMRR